jgi:DNA-binding NarL/FixJ family response regulator
VPGLRSASAIQVGLVADEPIRLEGLISIFETLSQDDGQAQLVPAPGKLDELMSRRSLRYLVFDMNSSSGGIETLELIRHTRPDIRVIVIGPEGNDELVLDCIVAGARAYLDVTAEPQAVRTAINAVTEGSIWATRRILSKLIDRLLTKRDTSLTNEDTHLTAREQQVLELILGKEFSGRMLSMRPENSSFFLVLPLERTPGISSRRIFSHSLFPKNQRQDES